VQFCKKLPGEIERVKNKIAAEFREVVATNQKSFQLALSEAEEMAWQTEFPQLFFPDLAVEKIQAVAPRRQLVHQPQEGFARAA
jgi:predicted secreted hydrolase